MVSQKPGFLYRIYTLSPQKAVRKLARLFGKGAQEPLLQPVTREFLESEEYRRIMARHLPYDGSYDRHEAQNRTASFLHRHQDQKDRLGIFRWRGIQENLDILLPLLTDPGKTIIDFGGAASSLGFGSIVVDRLDRDAFGNPVRFRSLSEIEGEVDVIFSSHTLEHIPDLDEVLEAMARKLKRNGTLILHLPSFSCERWRPGIHSNTRYNDHVWAFGLEDEPPIGGLDRYCNIRDRVEKFLPVDKAEYCGDDSIFLMATKKE